MQNRAEKISQRRSRLERQGYDLFAVSPNQGSRLHPGVYLRKGGSVKPILIFVSGVSYQKILDWFGVFERTVRDELPASAERAVQRAMDTAR